LKARELAYRVVCLNNQKQIHLAASQFADDNTDYLPAVDGARGIWCDNNYGGLHRTKCDMYDNSLLPVALANKLVSLANHPSSRILQKFAKNSLGA
jgi:hypothetical protein